MLLVPAYAVVIAAPAGPDQGCPSPRQTTDALMARIPAVVVPSDEASTPGVLRLMVSGGGGAAPLRIELTDQGGEARLYRNLTLAERGRAADCTALADTVALIVERFLHDLGYEAPPSPPPPMREIPRDTLARAPPAGPAGASRVDVFAGGSWRGASLDESDFEVGLGLGFERGFGGRRLAATFTGGVSSKRAAVLTDGAEAFLRRMPVRFGLFVPLPVGPGWLEPGFRLAVDWLIISTNSASGNETRARASPGVEVAVAYRVALSRRLFARLGVSGGAAVPYDVRTRPDQLGRSEVLFRQPRVYVKSGLELGFSFP